MNENDVEKGEVYPSVVLEAITQSTYKGESPEHFILRLARVSSDDPLSRKIGLFGFLIRQEHWSPFEMVNMVVTIRCSRAIARQILRHKSMHFQELSQRYKKIAKDSWIKNIGRKQGKKQRQQSEDPIDDLEQEKWAIAQEKVWNCCLDAYNLAIENGISKECARNLLPEGLTPTTLHVNGTIRSWIHYLNLRNDVDSGTQLEHRQITSLIMNIFKENFPIIYKDLVKKEGYKGWSKQEQEQDDVEINTSSNSNENEN